VNEQAELLKKRTKQFALDGIALLRTLPRSAEARSIGEQLIRSATGTAANYRAACRSRSDAEFVARIGVALEEADEAALWVEIITDAGLSRTTEAFRTRASTSSTSEPNASLYQS
jgi:four helix bundle protein